MATASLLTIELSYFNNAVFLAINRISIDYILKQCAVINLELNGIKKVTMLKSHVLNQAQSLISLSSSLFRIFSL